MRIASPRPRLDVRDLEVVLAVAAAGSTARAATALHVTQSAASRALLAAEEKLGARLFERTPRGLVPTIAGARLLDGAGPLLGQLVELEREALAPAERPVTLRLVCECYTAYRWLPSTLARLRERLPRVEVALAVEHTDAPASALDRGDVDVALLTTSRSPSRAREIALFSDEIVFVLAPTHPLAAKRALAADDLRRHPLITSAQTPEPERAWFTKRVFGARLPRQRGVYFPLTEAIVDAARAGMGVAILSEWIALPYVGGPDLVVKRFAGAPLRRPWRMAFRREVEGPARALAAALEPSAPRLRAAST